MISEELRKRFNKMMDLYDDLNRGKYVKEYDKAIDQYDQLAIQFYHALVEFIYDNNMLANLVMIIGQEMGDQLVVDRETKEPLL